MITSPQDSDQFRHFVAKTAALLDGADRQLQDILHNKALMAETPNKVQTAIASAAEAVDRALTRLNSITPQQSPPKASPDAPTRQQGQFLAFICKYMMSNSRAVAPSHADLQRFFNLTAPSVNSMLVRLEQRGFIRRIPGKARAIELTTDPALIPRLERPFKF